MQEIRVYITNIEKHEGGELVGEWFTAPIDIEKVEECLGVNAQNEEYMIRDHESPFEIYEYESIDEINHKWELYEELSESGGHLGDVDVLLRESGRTLEELVEVKDYIIFYPGAAEMSDVANHRAKKGGMLDSVPESLFKYFDFESYAYDLETRGDYVHTSSGIYELPI